MSRTLRSPIFRGSTVLLGLGVLLWLLLRAPVSAPHHGIQAYAPFQVLARHLQEPSGLARDPVTGHLFVAEADTGLILRIHFDEHGHAHLSTFATGFKRPRGLAWEAQDGSLLVVDEKAGSLSRITKHGKVSVLRKDLEKPQGVAVGEDGTISVTAEEGAGFKLPKHEEGVLLSFARDGSHPQLLVRGLKRPEGVRALLDGRIRFLADRLRSESERAGGTVFEYGPDDDLDVLVRDGFKQPHDLSLDALDATYLTADRQRDGEDWRLERGVIGKAFDEEGVALFATGFKEPRGLLFDADGNLYVAEAEAGRILKFLAPSSPTLATLPPLVTKEATLNLTGSTEPNAVLTVRGATVPLPPQDDVSAQVALRTSPASSDDRRGRLIYRVTLTNTGKTPLASPLAIVLTSLKPSEVTLANATGTTTEGDPYVKVPLLGGLLRPGERVQATLRFVGPHRHRVRFTPKIWPLRPVAVSDAKGRFSLPVTLTPNTENQLELFATAHYGLGLTSAPTRITVTHDDQPPETSITSGPTGTVSITGATFTFTGSDVLTKTTELEFAWRLDGGSWSPFGPETSATLTGLSQGPHTFEVKARDRAGNEDLTPAQRAFTVSSLQVTITEPAEGATINADSVLVRGTVEAAGAEVGVVVNGVAAFVQGTQWAAGIPLASGSNLITVTATSTLGTASTARIAVQVPQPQEPAVVLKASPASGLAPLTVRLEIQSGLDRPIVKYEFDQDGDGTLDVTSSTFENINVTYTTSGLITPALTLTDDQGRTVTATTIVQVLDTAATVAMLGTKWDGLKAALAAGDIPRAMAEIATGVRARFQEVFQALEADLPTIAPTLGAVAITRVTEGLAEGVTQRVQDGKTYLYFIYWAPDADGIWRIIEM